MPGSRVSSTREGWLAGTYEGLKGDAKIARRMRGANASYQHSVRAIKAGLEDEPCAEYKAMLSKLIRGLGRGMMPVVHGERGVGKTQMMHDLMLHSLYSGSPHYTTFARMLMRFRHGFTQHETLIAFGDPSLLVIDEIDLGTASPGDTSHQHAILAEVVDLRYNGLKDTVLVSNMTAKDLAEHLPASVLSRIGERGMFFHCGWPRLRTPMADRIFK